MKEKETNRTEPKQTKNIWISIDKITDKIEQCAEMKSLTYHSHVMRRGNSIRKRKKTFANPCETIRGLYGPCFARQK